MNNFYIGQNEIVVIDNDIKIELPKTEYGETINHFGTTDEMDLLEYLIVFGVLKRETLLAYLGIENKISYHLGEDNTLMVYKNGEILFEMHDVSPDMVDTFIEEELECMNYFV